MALLAMFGEETAGLVGPEGVVTHECCRDCRQHDSTGSAMFENLQGHVTVPINASTTSKPRKR